MKIDAPIALPSPVCISAPLTFGYLKGCASSLTREAVLDVLGWPADIERIDIDETGVVSITKGGIAYTREFFTP